MLKTFLLAIFLTAFITLTTMQMTKAYFADATSSTNNTFTTASEFPNNETSPLTAPMGSVVINELMWMGSTKDGIADEWIELRNMTSNSYDMSGWRLIGAANQDITIPSGTLPPNGFFLIANNASNSSTVNITPDFVTTAISLDNTGLQVFLANSANDIVDIADDGVGAPMAGFNSTIKRSMERKDPPGSGTNTSSWQNSTSQTNLDSSVVDFATPKAANSVSP
jgi:hypothetical protein